MKVTYNHPALPPVGIQIGKVYDAIEIEDSFKINDVEINKEIFTDLFQVIDSKENNKN